jgi:hypothetical protein
MTIYPPREPAALADSVANAIVLKVDEGAQAANPYYWHRAQGLFTDVVEEIAAYGDQGISAAADVLIGNPRSVAGWHELRDRVASVTSTATRLMDAGWAVAAQSRLDYHVGAEYESMTSIDQEWQARPANRPAEPFASTPVADIVIPFRDRSADGCRARNLVACLTALNDQTAVRQRYRVTVVESDGSPRWGDLVTRHADKYVFAPKPDLFNKCWAVNVGVRDAHPAAPLVCVLDADALVDREFVDRNTRRFHRAGAGAFLPFRDLFYLDDAASAWAVRERCLRHQERPRAAGLRGFLVHRSPGVCVWLRRDVFDAVQGMDERFEGWGREDIDFVLRIQLATAFDQYDDQMIHLHHPSSAWLSDGQTRNAHIPLLSWAPTEPIGQIDRFTA